MRSPRGRRQALDLPVSRRSRSGTNRRRALRGLSPTTLQLGTRRVIFAPLTPGEEAPFQSELKPVVIRAAPPPRQFRPRPENPCPVKHLARPRSVVSPFANQAVQPHPVSLVDRFRPAIELGKMIRTPQKELVLAIYRKYGNASLILA